MTILAFVAASPDDYDPDPLDRFIELTPQKLESSVLSSAKRSQSRTKSIESPRILEGSSRLPRHSPRTRSETPRSKYYRNRTEQLCRRRIHMHNDFNCKQETLNRILVRFLHTISTRFGVLGCFLRRVPPRVVWRKTWWNEGNDKCRETRACDGLHRFTFGAHMMPRHPASHVSESGRLVAVC